MVPIESPSEVQGRRIADQRKTEVTRWTDCLTIVRLRRVFWSAAIVLGFLQTWRDRFAISEDGVSYLDVGDAWARGDWHAAVNAYWSPMYSWVLAAVLHVIHPSLFSESLVVHLVNFVLYLL